MTVNRKVTAVLTACILLGLAVSGCTGAGGGSRTSRKYEDSDLYTAGGGIIENTITSIVVHAGKSNVEFVVSDQGILSVEDRSESSSELKEDWKLHYYQDGLTLLVEEYASEVSIAGAPQKTIVIYVPEGNTYALLEGESESGNVTVTGVLADQLDLETKSGEITVTDSTARSMSVESSSGNILIDEVTSSAIEGESSTGDLDISLSSQPYRVELETSSGNVHLALPEIPGFTLDLELGDGMLIDGYGMTQETAVKDSDSDGDERTYVVGTGENRYSIETGSGEVNVEVKE